MSFCTVLHTLNSPQNVGMIVRSHVAYGGNEVVFVGHELPWRFKKGSQAFSRKLERQVEILHFPNESDFFIWANSKQYSVVAIEIDKESILLNDFDFPDRCAIVVGNEAKGLSETFMKQCLAVVTIPQKGKVGSLNVAVSASIAMYELRRNTGSWSEISGNKYKGEFA